MIRIWVLLPSTRVRESQARFLSVQFDSILLSTWFDNDCCAGPHVLLQVTRYYSFHQVHTIESILFFLFLPCGLWPIKAYHALKAHVTCQTPLIVEKFIIYTHSSPRLCWLM